MTPTLRNARWYADVRAEALASKVALPQVYAMDDAIKQSIQDLTQSGRLSIDDGRDTRWGLGLEGTPANVGEPVRRFIVASWSLNDGGAQLDPFELYARGLEQQLAQARGDAARTLNPTPRKNYDDQGAAPSGGAVGLALALIAGLLILPKLRRGKK